ncbi:hypothetical protein [Bacillus paranthracis]|uniref:hypothetical protein n=1 Tax=Bacillus paranthracis TaxID=2026186 RepID=UPI001581B183|nr:hypothetical protein [Bacillus paranthracis]NUJ06937.1 hypothetical protein [Bacillus paranthracis]
MKKSDNEKGKLVDFTESRKNNVLKSIETYFSNMQIKKILINFFTPIINTSYPLCTLSRASQSINKCLLILVEYSPDVKKMTWNNFCKQMQEIERMNSSLRVKTRELLVDFYIYVEKYTSNKRVAKQINSFATLMLKKELTLSSLSMNKLKNLNSELLDTMRCKIFTHFPIESDSGQIYQTSIEQKNGDVLMNIYIKTNNLFLRDLLIRFVEHLKNIYPSSRNVMSSVYHRIFQFYFEKSLKELGERINTLSSFNLETYVKQYVFFQKIMKQYSSALIDKSEMVLAILFQFYLYVNQLHKQEIGTDLLHIKLFFNRSFRISIREGYTAIYRNIYESVPNDDKWILLPNTEHKSAAYNKGCNNIDFSLVVNNKFREDLKHYIWTRGGSDSTVRREAYVLTDLLNTVERYYIESQNVLTLGSKNEREYFTGDFLLKYIAKMGLRRTKNKTLLSNSTFNGEIAVIRMYLKQYRTKYDISDIVLEQLKYRKIDHDGGNPMTPNDFKLIQENFRRKVSIDSDGELMFIIFQLACTTKLRIGEILLLERDCIKLNSQSLGIGEITYYSKTSHGEKVTEILLEEDMKLIQRAKEITESLVMKASEGYEKYIFLVQYKLSLDMVSHMENRFTKFFRTIINELSDKGLLEKDYRAYDTRHTFIDTTWKAVEDGQINTMSVSAITGNSPRVALKHYRNPKIKRYVEAVHMITVGDVTIEGEIINDEKIIENLPQVEQGAGACKSEECIKLEIDNEDSEYKCLTCKKFITSIERIRVFENRLDMYKKKREEAENSMVQQYYNGLVELYATYLVEILNKEAEVMNT